MLVLSRKIGEQVVIGGTIRLNVLAVKGNQVRLGIAAPEQVSIWRAELVADDPSVTSRCPNGKETHALSHV